GDANDLEALDRTIVRAREESASRPVLVVVRSHIAWGSPHKQDSHEAHGAPLGAAEVELTKRNLGWPSVEPFFVPEEVRAAWGRAVERGAALHAEWRETWARFAAARPEDARELQRRWQRLLPDGWTEHLPRFSETD